MAWAHRGGRGWPAAPDGYGAVGAGASSPWIRGWRTILPGMPPTAFAAYASAACASGYTAPTWGRRCPWSTGL